MHGQVDVSKESFCLGHSSSLFSWKNVIPIVPPGISELGPRNLSSFYLMCIETGGLFLCSGLFHLHLINMCQYQILWRSSITCGFRKHALGGLGHSNVHC